MADISKIKLPDGITYTVKDTVSGYTKNTGTVTSVGLQNGGGLTVSGSPVTTSGTITVGHSNSITAQNTQGVYPVTIDANGHVASYGAKEDLFKVFTFESSDGTPMQDFSTVLVYSDAVNIAKLTEINSIFDTKKVAIQFISTMTGFEHTVMAFGTGERFDIDATAAGLGTLSNNMMFSFSGDYGDETSIIGYLWSDTSRLYSGTLVVIPSLNAIMVRRTRIDTNSYLSKNSVLTLQGYGAETSEPINVTPDTDISQITISHAALNSSGAKETQAVYPITVDVGGHITSAGNAVTIPTAGTTATAVSTTASGGSASTYSKSDHVHSLSSSTVTSALGYTPYNSTNPNGYTSNAGTVTGVTAGTGLTGGTISTSGTIALDTTRAITASDISTGTDTTNKLVSAKVIADAIAGAGGGGEGFKVTLSLSGQTYSVDKTFAEIEAAVAAKKYVYLYDATGSAVQSDCIVLPYAGSMQGDAAFEYLDGNTQITYSVYLDGSDTKVSLYTNTIGGSGIQSVSGTSPISASTSSGAATISLANGYGDTKNPYGTKSANTVLAGPVSGSAAAPTFRELVRSDQFIMVTPQDLTNSQFLDSIAQMFPVYRFGMNLTNGGEEIFVELYSVGPVNHETIWIGSDIYGIRYWEFDGSGTQVTNNYFEYPVESGVLALEGGNDFFVTLSYDDMEEEYSVDKTFLEIDAAYAAGKKLYMILPEDNTITAYQGGLTPIPLTETFWSPDPVSSTLLGMYVFSAEYPFSSKPTDVNGTRYSICVSIDDSDTLRVGEYPVKNIKITEVAPTTLTTYRGVFADSQGKSLLTDGGYYNGIVYKSRAGTTSTNGISALVLGNGTNSGSNGNRYGYISLYPQSGNYTNSIVSAGTLTANRTLTLPDKSGTLATTDDITAAINALDASNTSY